MHCAAGVVQWQNGSFPSFIQGFDSPHPLQPKFSHRPVHSSADVVVSARGTVGLDSALQGSKGPPLSTLLRILHTGLAAAPQLAAADSPAAEAAAAHGPFELESVPTLQGLAERGLAGDTHQGIDAVLLGADDPATLIDWPALAPTALATAVVAVLPDPTPAVMARLFSVGVQDLLLPAEAADPVRLARALRAAVERKRLDIATRRAYATDLSTGLPNHPQLLEHMSHLLALREREPAPMALIVLRVQGLAQTEAALGPESAQVLRRKVAVRLRSGLRASDVVASIGPDAFAVLLAWIDAPEDGERVLGKLATSLAATYRVAGREQALQVSAGLASYPAHGKDAAALLHRALSQAASMASIGQTTPARAADRGPDAAANDET